MSSDPSVLDHAFSLQPFFPALTPVNRAVAEYLHCGSSLSSAHSIRYPNTCLGLHPYGFMGTVMGCVHI